MHVLPNQRAMSPSRLDCTQIPDGYCVKLNGRASFTHIHLPIVRLGYMLFIILSTPTITRVTTAPVAPGHCLCPPALELLPCSLGDPVLELWPPVAPG